MNKLRIMSVFGTRPEAIKMCPLVKELASRPEIESLCCVTAQHRQMLDSVLEVFEVKPDWDLDIMTPRQTLSTITSKCLTGMDEAIDTLKPDMILVHGDTSTTFAGALSAFYHQVKVGHVEAGLRTYDKWSPFPEEMNRTLVGDIADLHFSPTKANAENLRREAVMGDVFITGNTAIDAMRYTVNQDFRFDIPELDSLDFTGKRVVVIGGGNVAMDVTRSSVRLGASSVTCVYRRRIADMTALPDEVKGAIAEGAEVRELCAPVRIEANEAGEASALWVQPQIIGFADKSGRPRPEAADQPEERIPADLIIVAIGQGVEIAGFEQTGIPIKRGTFMAESSSQVDNMETVFAGGDCVTGPATAIRAIAAGKVAAATSSSDSIMRFEPMWKFPRRILTYVRRAGASIRKNGKLRSVNVILKTSNAA